MPALFISYSRHDASRTQQIVQVLEAIASSENAEENMAVWMDTELEYSVPWWTRICEEIENATHVVIVLSNHYLASEVCNEELQFAMERGKPIIPVLIDPLDKARIRGEQRTRQQELDTWQRQTFELADTHFDQLHKLNFITAAPDTAEQTAHAITKAVFQDLPYTQGLQRWTSRAYEWQQLNHSHRSLLTGHHLDNAEVWRDQAVGKNHTVPDVVLTYISQSRLAQRLRQRNLLVASFTALLIVCVLAVLSFALFRESEANLSLANLRGTGVREQESTAIANANRAATNEAVAVVERDMAVAARLLSNAQALLVSGGGNTETAALLAIRSLQTSRSSEASLFLQQILSRLHTTRIIPSPGRRGFVGTWLEGEADPLLLRYLDDVGMVRVDPQTGETITILEDSLVGVSNDGFNQAFSADGKLFLTREGNSYRNDDTAGAALWDVQTGALLRRFDNEAEILAVALSSDGSRVLIGTMSGEASLWDVAIGEPLHTFALRQPVTSAAFSPDGRWLFIGRGNAAGVLFDANTYERIRDLPEAQGTIITSFAADSASIFTSTYHETSVQQWSVETGERLRTFTGHNRTIQYLKVSPDGSRLLTAADCLDPVDCSVILWDVATANVLGVFTGQTESFISLGFGPGDQFLGAAPNDNHARIWRLNESSSQTNELLGIADAIGAVLSVDYAADGHAYVTSSVKAHVPPESVVLTNIQSIYENLIVDESAIRLWESPADSQRWRHEVNGFARARLSDDGSRVLVFVKPDMTDWRLPYENAELRVLDEATGEMLFRLDDVSEAAVSYSFDGRWVLVNNSASASLYHTETAEQGVYQGYEGHQFSPDNSMLLLRSAQGQWSLLILDSGEIRSLSGIENDTEVSFAPDSRHLTALRRDSTTNATRLQTLRTSDASIIQTQEVAGQMNESGFVVAPDSRYAALSTLEPTPRIYVWETSALLAGQPPHRIFEQDAPIRHLSFVPQSDLLFVIGREYNAHIWDLPTGALLNEYDPDFGWFSELEISPSGRYLMIGNGTEYVVRDISSGEVVHTTLTQNFLRGFLNFTFASDDGRALLSYMDLLLGESRMDGGILTWIADETALIEYACNRIFRDFTTEEQERYGITSAETCPSLPADRS